MCKVGARVGLSFGEWDGHLKPHMTNLCSNERSSEVYTTSVLTKMLLEEGGLLFDARSAALGHTLQGGIPSPMDRVRAVRLSLKCMAFIEHHHELMRQYPAKSRPVSSESAAVITIQGSAVKWVPVREMLEHTDTESRRGLETWWAGIPALVEAMVGRRQFL